MNNVQRPTKPVLMSVDDVTENLSAENVAKFRANLEIRSKYLRITRFYFDMRLTARNSRFEKKMQRYKNQLNAYEMDLRAYDLEKQGLQAIYEKDDMSKQPKLTLIKGGFE